MKKIRNFVFLLFTVLLLTGCSTKKLQNRLTIGASLAPHAEILKHIKPELKKEGIDLEIKIFNDYVLPNAALDAYELDVNYYQHTPYMNKSNSDNGYKFDKCWKGSFETTGAI